MSSGLAGIVLSVAGVAAIPIQAPYLGSLLNYQNHDCQPTIISGEVQTLIRERDTYFENIINNYFRLIGNENNAISNLSTGIDFSIEKHRFRIRINLNDMVKILELVADEYYFDDKGVNGVDECGLAGQLGSDGNMAKKTQFRLTKLVQSDRLIFDAADKVQVAAMKVISLYTGKNNVVDSEVIGTLAAYDKEVQRLKFLLRAYT